MKRKIDHNDSLHQLLLHFILASGSALILSLAYIFADFWFAYIIALLPFLLRLINTDFKGSVINGLFLTISIGFVTFSGEYLRSPLAYSGNFLLICASFTLFSVIINRLRRYFALSFILFIALCIPLEYIHKHYFEFNVVFEALKHNTGFVLRATSLSGIIIISLVLIAVNSLLFLLIGILRRGLVSKRYYSDSNKPYIYTRINDRALLRHRECLPYLRGPPV